MKKVYFITNKSTKPGVYKLSCGSCIFVAEPKRFFIKRRRDSNSSKHRNSDSYNFNANFELVHSEKK